jgi:hypothetical protein
VYFSESAFEINVSFTALIGAGIDAAYAKEKSA